MISVLRRPSASHISVVVLFCCGLPSLLVAASLRERLAEARQAYRTARWDTREGLPQNYVHAIAQTRDGYLWVGTSDGLARFNGHEFTVFRLEGADIVNVNIRSLLVARDGALWVATDGSGVFRFDGQRFARVAPDTLHRYARSLAQDQDGAIWVATGRGVFRWDQGALTHVTEADGLPSGSAYTVMAAPSGTLYVGLNRGGVGRRAGGRFEMLPLPAPASQVSAMAVTEAPDGSVWIGTWGAGVWRYAAGEMRGFGVEMGLPSLHVRCVAFDRAGDLWVGTSLGLVRWDGHRFARPVTPQDRLNEDTFHVSEDHEANLWIGSTRGLVRLNRGQFASISVQDGLSHDVVLCVAPATGGGLWAGTNGAGLNLLRDGRTERFGSSGPLGTTFDTVFSVAEWQGWRVFVGTYSGLFEVRNGRLERPPLSNAIRVAVRALHADRAGGLWIGTEQGGVFHLTGDLVQTAFTTKDGLPGAAVRVIGEDAAGTIWIGTDAGLAARTSDGKFRLFTVADGLPHNAVRALLWDARGRLWAGTAAGLACREERFRGVRASHGLHQENIYQVLDDRQGYFWISCPRGLYRVSVAELETVLSGERTVLGSAPFGREFGISSSECRGGNQPAGARTPEGLLVFPTVSGLAVIDPAALPENSRPPLVHIESVRFGDVAVPVKDGIATVGPGQRLVEIAFTALCLQSPDRVQYRYELEGVDPEATDPDQRRHATYHNLAPGEYRFRVTAANNHGVWNREGATLMLRVRPEFYQTRWFQVLAAFGLVGSVGGVYLARTRRLRQRQAHLARIVAERTKTLQAEVAHRRRTEEELRRSEERFSRAFGANPIPMALLGLEDGRLLDANPGFFAFIARQREQAIGATDLELNLWINPEDRRKVFAAVQGGQPLHNFECKLRAARGPRQALVSGDVVQLASGPHLLLILIDIADRVALEQQLRHLQKIEAVGGLAAGVAHDFNNLLTVIQGHVSLLLLDGARRDEDRLSLEQVKSAATRAATLTRQLLAYSRKQRLEGRPLQLNDVLRRLTPMLEPVLGEPIKLGVQLAPDLPLVFGDESQLEQVVVNIAVNARDAMPAGGTFHVATTLVALDADTARRNPEARPGRFVRLTLADTGIGMDDETRQRVFEPFFTTKEVGRGTGLGLATAYGIIKQHQGWIEIETAPGRGSTFTVFLPVTSDPAKSELLPASAAPVRLGKGEHILLVEDDVSLRSLVQHVLVTNGYRVIAAEDGPTALRLAEAEPRVDLLFTDVVMPNGMSGLQLADKLRAGRPGLRVVFATGYSRDMCGLRQVADRIVIAKPFDPETLLVTIRQALAARVG